MIISTIHQCPFSGTDKEESGNFLREGVNAVEKCQNTDTRGTQEIGCSKSFEIIP